MDQILALGQMVSDHQHLVATTREKIKSELKLFLTFNSTGAVINGGRDCIELDVYILEFWRNLKYDRVHEIEQIDQIVSRFKKEVGIEYFYSTYAGRWYYQLEQNIYSSLREDIHTAICLSEALKRPSEEITALRSIHTLCDSIVSSCSCLIDSIIALHPDVNCILNGYADVYMVGREGILGEIEASIVKEDLLAHGILHHYMLMATTNPVEEDRGIFNYIRPELLSMVLGFVTQDILSANYYQALNQCVSILNFMLDNEDIVSLGLRQKLFAYIYRLLMIELDKYR